MVNCQFALTFAWFLSSRSEPVRVTRYFFMIGHKILIAVYHILKDKVDYKELGADHLNNFRRDKLIDHYKKQLANLGEEIVQVA